MSDSSEIGRGNKVQGKTKVAVKIYDEEYVIKGQADPNVIEKIAAYVDRKMRLVGQKNPQLPLSKVAVLAALNIAEDFVKLHEDYNTLSKQFDEVKKLGSGS
ncbi:MAG TPA: cell division protein ZapA [Syntrophomonadaceae bacterium]|nr:cell division protein ZapA [Syntrophomonadaceae bacterium]